MSRPSVWALERGSAFNKLASSVRRKRKQYRISKWLAESTFQMTQEFGREQSGFYN
jgi:hypothetical protein